MIEGPHRSTLRRGLSDVLIKMHSEVLFVSLIFNLNAVSAIDLC